MEAIHLEIRGRVQGVGFRWFVQREARALGLRGWVANRPDGNVELAAGGDALALGKLEQIARKGPPGAVVDGVARLAPPDIDSLPIPFVIAR
jgi:acylphosphatase